jgi:hypothetical protein
MFLNWLRILDKLDYYGIKNRDGQRWGKEMVVKPRY